jgi:hypothetical protein
MKLQLVEVVTNIHLIMMFDGTAPGMFSLPNAPWHTNKYVMCPTHKEDKAAQNAANCTRV